MAVAFLLLQFTLQPGSAAVYVCQFPSHWLLHLYDSQDPYADVPQQKGNVKCVAQLEIILISREQLNLKVKVQLILSDFGRATWVIPLTNLQLHCGLNLHGPREDPIANKI